VGQARKRHEPGEYYPHVRKGDEVLVRAGRAVRERGRVISVDPQRERAVVEGLNLIIKHQKPTGGGGATAQRGGRMEVATPIHLSNLMVVCPSCHAPTRVGHKEVGGQSSRACKRCDAPLDRVDES